MQVEVDDGLVLGRPVGNLVGEQPGQLGVGGELVDPADRADQVRGVVVEPVVGGRHRPAVDGELVQVVQGVLAVVPLDEHGEHRLARGHGEPEPRTQEADDALRDGGQRVEARGARVSFRHGVDLLELVRHRAEHGCAVGVDERLVEPAEADTARQVADDGEAQLGGRHQPVEQLAGGRLGLRAGRGLDQPALQDGGGHRHLGGRALLRQEHPEHRPFELLGALDPGDAVVAEHPLEPPDEVRRQRTALGVEGLQVGVEVLARAVHAVLDVGLLAHRPVAAQLGEVGEDGEQVHLVADR